MYAPKTYMNTIYDYDEVLIYNTLNNPTTVPCCQHHFYCGVGLGVGLGLITAVRDCRGAYLPSPYTFYDLL